MKNKSDINIALSDARYQEAMKRLGSKAIRDHNKYDYTHEMMPNATQAQIQAFKAGKEDAIRIKKGEASDLDN
ncbi:MAG TPA: hypothetical protein DIW17_04045 [Clostridiales bacterium]|nr:hypothetical protein [Clostridiales bacterium]